MTKRTLLLVFLLGIFSFQAFGQLVPKPVLGYCYYQTGNVWLPVFMSSGSSVTYSPSAVGLYAYNGTSYGPLNCDSSGRLVISSASTITLSGFTQTASKNSFLDTSTLFTGGTGTTTQPLWLQQPTGATAVSTWSTSGTFKGINAASGFSGNFEDFYVNGGSSLFSVTSGGNVNAMGIFSNGITRSLTFGSSSNCSSSASPAVCGSSIAGSVVIAAGATTVQVNTNEVGANTQVFVMPDTTLGTKLAVTCNTTSGQFAGPFYISARTAGSNFTIATTGTTPSGNPVCLSFFIIN